MQLRRRSLRPTWDLNVTEPVASNFYPMTSHATITGPLPHSAFGSIARQLLLQDASNQYGSLAWNATFATAADASRPVDAAALRDAPAGQQRDGTAALMQEDAQRNVTLAVVTERAQAVGSLEPGSLHVLLHRRLLQV